MVENSIYNGALYRYRTAGTGEGDVASMLSHLKVYWLTVATVFAAAWGLPPRKSRLTHGAGIAAMGYLMDHLTEGLDLADVGRASSALEQLSAVPWTSGEWGFSDGARRWNALQNTPNDIRILSSYLVSLLPASMPRVG